MEEEGGTFTIYGGGEKCVRTSSRKSLGTGQLDRPRRTLRLLFEKCVR
jgi:hypothetical protein